MSSTVAAIRKGQYKLSLGALTGAGMFVNCVSVKDCIPYRACSQVKGVMTLINALSLSLPPHHPFSSSRSTRWLPGWSC